MTDTSPSNNNEKPLSEPAVAPSTPVPANTPPKAPEKNLSQAPAAGHKGKWLALVVALLALILVIAASTWYWLERQQLQQQLTTLMQERDAVQSSAAAQSLQIEQFGSALMRMQDEYNSQLPGLQEKTQYLAQELKQLAGGTRSDWLLAEAEYLMRLANQRMNLEYDAAGAEAMLTAADGVLQEIGDPALFQVREQLAQEILSLQAVRPIDLEQGFIRLHALIKQVSQLSPGQFTESVTPPAEPVEAAPAAAQDFWQSIKADLFRLLRVKRLDQPVEPLMAPEQHYYVQQNLRLMLEQASQSLLAGEATVFRASLDKAEQWLQQYFDQRNPQVAATLLGVQSLQSAQVARDKVDISSSLRLLRQHVETLYRSHQLSRTLAPKDENGVAP